MPEQDQPGVVASPLGRVGVDNDADVAGTTPEVTPGTGATGVDWIPVSTAFERPVGRTLVAAVGLSVGVALTWFGLSGPLTGWSSYLVVGAGVVSLLVGVDAMLKRAIGPQVQTGVVLSLAWLIIVFGTALGADLLPLAEAQDPSLTVTETPLLRPDLFSAHPLGSDRQSLDVLGGIVYGARVSLTIGLGAVGLGLLVGGSLGVLAGYYRGKLDSGVGLLSDSLLAFPPLILLLALVAVLQPSVRNVTLALALLSVPIYLRLARANTLSVAEREFVLMARALGDKDRRILLREIVPNVLPSLLAYAFVMIAVMIVAEASLSYLGLSVQRPNPTWGNLIAAGENSVEDYPHLVFAPGVVLFLTVFSLNRVGEAARSRWISLG